MAFFEKQSKEIENRLPMTAKKPLLRFVFHG